METMAGKTLIEMSEYFEGFMPYRDEQPHALCVAYFENVTSSEGVKIELLKSILDKLEELVSKDFVKAMSSNKEDLLINALLQDFGFIEELDVRGGTKFRITEIGLCNMEDVRAYIKKYNQHRYEKRKKNRNDKR